MGKLIVFVTIFLVWAAGALIFVTGLPSLAPEITKPKGLDILLADSSRTIYSEQIIPEDTPGEKERFADLKTQIAGRDTRVTLVNRFLAQYRSPMAGHGADFIAAADLYGLDWRLLPAIAFQESNLGKKIPRGSYNAFGWGIYAGKNSGVRFISWSDSIYQVAKGMKFNYISQGLSTPETIVLRYTDTGSPNWVYAVKTAMQEISSLEY